MASIAQLAYRMWTSTPVHDTAYLSLVTFTTSSTQIRDALIRMAMARDTVSGLALFFALLSFSSLHRGGLHQQAIQLKISALQCLSAPAKGRLSSAEAAQHVAGSMLLSAFEVGLMLANVHAYPESRSLCSNTFI